MKTTQFYSHRIKDDVVIVMTLKNIYYISNSLKTEIVINRPHTFHLNEDGIYRAQELFDDPRFMFWMETGEINNL